MLRYPLAFMTALSAALFVVSAISLDLQGIVLGLAYGLVFGSLTWMAWPRPQFMDWLAGNRKAIEYKTARYKGSPVTLDTVVVQYEVLISFIHFTWVKEMDYEVLGSPWAQATRWGGILASLLLGWWSIPGLIEMPKLLERNRTHANSVTVRKLLEVPGAAAGPEPELEDGFRMSEKMKLEVAAVQLEMGNEELAREILNEVLRDGTADQQRSARSMLAAMSECSTGFRR